MRQTVIIFLLINLLITGCFSKPKPVEEEVVPQEEREEVEQPIGTVEPLTGLAAAGDIDHPVIMVMVNNQAKARPQTGLDRADLVFEILAEGEITRFAAFYHSETEGTVGPVRSARPYYLDLGEGFDAVIAHAGGSPDAMERYQQPDYPSIDGITKGERYYWRADFRVAPHNLYTRLENLREGIADNGFSTHTDIPQLTFDDTNIIVEEGLNADTIEIGYHPLYSVGYQYDIDSGQYVRLTQGETHIDLETEEPLVMDNVLVIEAPHVVLDDLGRRSVDVTGSGTGWLFQKGKGERIDWKYENGFPRPYVDGEELPLIPGKTWINVVPEQTNVHYE